MLLNAVLILTGSMCLPVSESSPPARETFLTCALFQFRGGTDFCSSMNECALAVIDSLERGTIRILDRMYKNLTKVPLEQQLNALEPHCKTVHEDLDRDEPKRVLQSDSCKQRGESEPHKLRGMFPKSISNLIADLSEDCNQLINFFDNN